MKFSNIKVMKDSEEGKEFIRLSSLYEKLSDEKKISLLILLDDWIKKEFLKIIKK